MRPFFHPSGRSWSLFRRGDSSRNRVFRITSSPGWVTYSYDDPGRPSRRRMIRIGRFRGKEKGFLY
jgi:hypothetical protein